MENETQKSNEELITIAGGVELEVAYRNNGSSEKIKVRQIPISKLQKYLASMGNESALIELYCDKEEGWADTLTLESVSAVLDKGEEIHHDFLERWFRRQGRLRKTQQEGMAGVTGVTDEIEKRINQLIESRLASSQPVSPTSTT